MRKRESKMLSIDMAKKENGVVPAGSLVLGLGIAPASLIYERDKIMQLKHYERGSFLVTINALKNWRF